MKARAAWMMLIAGLIGACGWGSGRGLPSAAAEPIDVVAFAERIDEFYGALAGVPLDSAYTYEDRRLRPYFRDEASFADYYAALANRVREANLRNARPSEVRVREFRFENPRTAIVEVEIVGEHRRELLFWGVDLARRDTWQLVDGVWVLVPDKL